MRELLKHRVGIGQCFTGVSAYCKIFDKSNNNGGMVVAKKRNKPG